MGETLDILKHDEILKKGVVAWNQWRKDNPDIQPALIMAKLQEEDLNGANLSGANLSGADLSGSNIRGVNLRRANLTGVDLSNANLSGADLSNANLSGVDLSGADLIETILRWANLYRAKVDMALHLFQDNSSYTGTGRATGANMKPPTLAVI